MVGPYFYTDDPVRDAADYYAWLEETGVTLEEENEAENEGD